MNLTLQLKKLLEDIRNMKADNNRISHTLAGSILLETCAPSEVESIKKQAYTIRGRVEEATIWEKELATIIDDLQDYCEASDIEGSLQSVIDRVEFAIGKSKVYRKSWDINGKDKTRILSIDKKYNAGGFVICTSHLSVMLTVEDICANDWTSYTEIGSV